MFSRIFAIFIRHLYMLRHSPHRILNLFYWSTLELVIWGFLTVYLNGSSTTPGVNFIPVLLGGLLLWNFFNRIQQGISVSFLEDIWTRNLSNVFSSPIRPIELIAGYILLSFFESIVSMTFVSTLAVIFWKYNILSLNLALLPFAFNLYVLGWSVGILASSLIMWLGPSADILAWSLPVLMQPSSAVFYPVAILPHWLQVVAAVTPSSYVFEGMRTILATNTIPWTQLGIASLLNLVILALSIGVFYLSFRGVRRGGVLQRYIV